MRRDISTSVQGILALALTAYSGAAFAQNPPAGMPSGNGSANSAISSGSEKFDDKKVSVDADGAKLVDVLPKLLKSVGAEFIIAPEVKNALLSGHLTNVKFKSALDLLLRVSTIPVEVTYTEGMFRFSKKVELPAADTTPSSESALPLPPKQGEAIVDVRKAGTENIIRALTGQDPSILPPNPSGYSSGSVTSHSSYSSFGFSPNGVRLGSASSQMNSQGGNGSQSSGGGSITIFGHTFRLGNSGNTGRNGSSGGR